MLHILELFDYTPGRGNRLETRLCGVLLRNHVSSVEELQKMSDEDLLRMKGLGTTSIGFIRNKLNLLNDKV